MFVRLFIIFVVLPWVIWPAASFGETPAEIEAGEFIGGLPTIRIYVADAHRTGHQSATISIMHRLRELGFDGKIEVIYAPASKEKLGPLINGFAPGGPDVQMVEPNLEVISETVFRQQKRPPVLLGLTGGTEHQVDIGPYGINTENFLDLAPRGFGIPSLLRQPSSSRRTWLKPLQLMFLKQILPNPADPAAFVDEKMVASPFYNKRKGVQAILHRTIGGAADCELAPIYGREGTDVALLNYVEGLRTAYREHPESFKPGGAILPVFTELEADEDAFIRKQLRNLNADGKTGPRVVIHRFGDPGLEAALKPQPGEPVIHIVQVGNVPRDVFDLFFARGSLPALAEGRQTVNTLHTAGRAFLNTFTNPIIEDDVEFPYGEEVSKKVRALPPELDNRSVAEFIMKARTPGSDLAVNVETMRRRANDPAADMIVMGLRTVRRVTRSPEPEKELIKLGGFLMNACDEMARYLNTPLPQ